MERDSREPGLTKRYKGIKKNRKEIEINRDK